MGCIARVEVVLPLVVSSPEANRQTPLSLGAFNRLVHNVSHRRRFDHNRAARLRNKVGQRPSAPPGGKDLFFSPKSGRSTSWCRFTRSLSPSPSDVFAAASSIFQNFCRFWAFSPQVANGTFDYMHCASVPCCSAYCF